MQFDLSRSNKCIISEISITSEVGRDDPVDAMQTIGATFQINNA